MYYIQNPAPTCHRTMPLATCLPPPPAACHCPPPAACHPATRCPCPPPPAPPLVLLPAVGAWTRHVTITLRAHCTSDRPPVVWAWAWV